MTIFPTGHLKVRNACYFNTIRFLHGRFAFLLVMAIRAGTDTLARCGISWGNMVWQILGKVLDMGFKRKDLLERISKHK